jgi:hypothetical protein
MRDGGRRGKRDCNGNSAVLLCKLGHISRIVRCRVWWRGRVGAPVLSRGSALRCCCAVKAGTLPAAGHLTSGVAQRQRHRRCMWVVQAACSNIRSMPRSLHCPMDAVWSCARCCAPRCGNLASASCPTIATCVRHCCIQGQICAQLRWFKVWVGCNGCHRCTRCVSRCTLGMQHQ